MRDGNPETSARHTASWCVSKEPIPLARAATHTHTRYIAT